jgi:hypothetical protein
MNFVHRDYYRADPAFLYETPRASAGDACLRLTRRVPALLCTPRPQKKRVARLFATPPACTSLLRYHRAPDKTLAESGALYSR